MRVGQSYLCKYLNKGSTCQVKKIPATEVQKHHVRKPILHTVSLTTADQFGSRSEEEDKKMCCFLRPVALSLLGRSNEFETNDEDKIPTMARAKKGMRVCYQEGKLCKPSQSIDE